MTDNGRKVGASLLDVALPAHPISVPAARHAVHETLGDVPAANVAELVVSELVTNAILHARHECHLRVAKHDGALRIEVTDPSPEQPAPGPTLPGGLEEEGRGLRIVQALAEHYGVELEPGDGKTVWAEIDLQEGCFV